MLVGDLFRNITPIWDYIDKLMEPRLRACPAQFSALLDFMERHGDLSNPQLGAQGRRRSDRLWLKLSGLLNSVGGGVLKSSDKWKKVWADWKTKTKKKYLVIRQYGSAAGGGTGNQSLLTALEERVVAVIGAKGKAVRAGVQKQGFIKISKEEPSDEITFEVPQSRNFAAPHLRSLSDPLEMWVPLVGHTHAPPSTSHPPPTPPQRRLGARKNRANTILARAASKFAAIELRRLEQEELRDKRLHEREMERLRLESRRIEVDRENNALLIQKLGVVAQSLIDVLARQQPECLVSTDIFPDNESNNVPLGC